MIPFWLFLVVVLPVVAWAATVTMFLFVRNPLPFPDWGHCCFGVADERAATIVAGLCSELAGLKERFTFSPGPTNQTLMWDNTTVFIWFERHLGLPPNARSLVVKNPRRAANEAARILRESNYTATVHEGLVPDLDGKIFLIESDAFNGWALLFRLGNTSLGRPPKKRKLLKG